MVLTWCCARDEDARSAISCSLDCPRLSADENNSLREELTDSSAGCSAAAETSC